MTDLFLNAYKGYAPKEAGALSYYAKALANAGKLQRNGRVLPLAKRFGKGGIKQLSFNEKRDLLRALKNDTLHSLSLPSSHQNNALLRNLRTSVNGYYKPFALAKIVPPKNEYDFYRRLQDMEFMSHLRNDWTFGRGANYWVNNYNAPFLQGVKQPKMTTPESFTIN